MTPTHTDIQETMTKLLSVHPDTELASRRHVDQAQSLLYVIGSELTPKSKQSIQEWIVSVRHYINNMMVPPNYSDQTRMVIQYTRGQCHQKVKDVKEKVVWEWIGG